MNTCHPLRNPYFRPVRIAAIYAIGFMCLSVATSRGQCDEESRVPGLPVAEQSAVVKINIDRDWPWWRGPNRDGVANNDGQNDVGVRPLKLNAAEDADWIIPVPGRGHASPIILGDRVYLLSADEKEQIQFVIAFDRSTGKELWRKELNQGGFAEKNHPKNTEATSTLATNGERLFAVLWHRKKIWCVSLDLKGNILWNKEVGPYDPIAHPFGYGPSPIIYDDLVICSFEFDGPSALVALETSSGEERWRIPRQEETSYSTPAIRSYRGQDYLLISGGDHVAAYSPKTGAAIWKTQGTTMATCGTIVWFENLVFASGGFPGAETICLDIESGEVQWRNRQKAYEQSMIVVDGCLLNFTDSGVLYCWDCRTGKELWKKRMAGPVSSSPILIGKYIYWSNEAGKLFVFECGLENYKEVAEYQFGVETFSSPAYCGGEFFIRYADGYGDERQEYLGKFSKQEVGS